MADHVVGQHELIHVKDRMMSPRARIYVASVLVMGTLIATNSFAILPQASQWPAFFVLLLAASIAQLNKNEAPAYVLFYATPIFILAGAFLLPPPLFVLLVAIPHLIEWARERWRQSQYLRNWYLQPFNIAKHLIAGTAAHYVYVTLALPSLIPGMPVLAKLTMAGMIYVVLNQFLLGQALVVARHVSWRASRVFDVDSLLPECVMACMSITITVIWPIAPWLVVPVMAPWALLYRALIIPKLKQDAQHDGKTGLVNAHHFNALFVAELERAIRFKRPLTLIMADLDLLRAINNTYGHLAGDYVLAGVANVLAGRVRPKGGIAGRFGGEEFAVLLPETTCEEALDVTEQTREAIEAARFEVPGNETPLQVTMSFGVASYPADGATMMALIQAADVALYQAKAQGRNRVVCSADVPLVLRTRFVANGATSTDPVDESVARVSRTSVLPLASLATEASTTPIKTVEPAVSAEGHAVGAKRAGLTPSLPEQQEEGRRRDVRNRLPDHARLWVAVVLLAGLVESVVGLRGLVPALLWQPVFGILLLGASCAQLYKADGPNHELFHPVPVFLFAGVLLLPAPLLVLLVVVPHLLEWASARWRRSPQLRAWYLQPYNMAMYVTAGLLAQLVLAILGVQRHGEVPLSPLVVGAAVLSYALTNQLILGLALQLARGITWRESKVLTSGLLTEVVLACLGCGVALQWQESPWLLIVALAPLALIYQSLSIPKLQAENIRALEQVNGELTQANHAIGELNDELFLTLAKIFDARDPYVGGHAAQVAGYAVAVAKELGLPPGRLELIRQAGYLHDIGKMAIPETILHKSCKLTDEEFEIIKTHAVIGAGFLETSHGLRHLAPFVRYHHERWDGRGYPDGLVGEAIPLESRILNVCDSVEAMASDRPYHTGMPVEAIITELHRCTGTQFDPLVAEIFIRIAEREGSQFVVNSARVVDMKQADPSTIPIFNSGLIFAKVYNQTVV